MTTEINNQTRYETFINNLDSIQEEQNKINDIIYYHLNFYIDILNQYKHFSKENTIFIDILDEEIDIPEKPDRYDKIKITKHNKDSIEFCIHYYKGNNEWDTVFSKAPVQFFFDVNYRNFFDKEIGRLIREKQAENEKKEQIHQAIQKEIKYRKYINLKNDFEEKTETGKPSEPAPETISNAIQHFKSIARQSQLERQLNQKPDIELQHQDFIFLHLLKGTDYTKTSPDSNSESLKKALEDIKKSSSLNPMSYRAALIKRFERIFAPLNKHEFIWIIKNTKSLWKNESWISFHT